VLRVPESLTVPGPLLKHRDLFRRAGKRQSWHRSETRQAVEVTDAPPGELACGRIAGAYFQGVIAGPTKAPRPIHGAHAAVPAHHDDPPFWQVETGGPLGRRLLSWYFL